MAEQISIPVRIEDARMVSALNNIGAAGERSFSGMSLHGRGFHSVLRQISPELSHITRDLELMGSAAGLLAIGLGSVAVVMMVWQKFQEEAKKSKEEMESLNKTVEEYIKLGDDVIKINKEITDAEFGGKLANKWDKPIEALDKYIEELEKLSEKNEEAINRDKGIPGLWTTLWGGAEDQYRRQQKEMWLKEDTETDIEAVQKKRDEAENKRNKEAAGTFAQKYIPKSDVEEKQAKLDADFLKRMNDLMPLIRTIKQNLGHADAAPTNAQLGPGRKITAAMEDGAQETAAQFMNIAPQLKKNLKDEKTFNDLLKGVQDYETARKKMEEDAFMKEAEVGDKELQKSIEKITKEQEAIDKANEKKIAGEARVAEKKIAGEARVAEMMAKISDEETRKKAQAADRAGDDEMRMLEEQGKNLQREEKEEEKYKGRGSMGTVDIAGAAAMIQGRAVKDPQEEIKKNTKDAADFIGTLVKEGIKVKELPAQLLPQDKGNVWGPEYNA
jgi:hypothetical protein